jgi:hypothetical protein
MWLKAGENNRQVLAVASTLAIDISTMSDRKKVKHSFLEIEGVNRAVISDAQPVSI